MIICDIFVERWSSVRSRIKALETETMLQLDIWRICYDGSCSILFFSTSWAWNKRMSESGSSTSECSVGNLQSLRLIDRDIYGQDLQVCRAREQLDHWGSDQVEEVLLLLLRLSTVQDIVHEWQVQLLQLGVWLVLLHWSFQVAMHDG